LERCCAPDKTHLYVKFIWNFSFQELKVLVSLNPVDLVVPKTRGFCYQCNRAIPIGTAQNVHGLLLGD
ncbi:MAG: hypothetical protein V1659_05245, partial [Candidatus Woesearchaeota archaeon]